MTDAITQNNIDMDIAESAVGIGYELARTFVPINPFETYATSQESTINPYETPDQTTAQNSMSLTELKAKVVETYNFIVTNDLIKIESNLVENNQIEFEMSFTPPEWYDQLDDTIKINVESNLMRIFKKRIQQMTEEYNLTKGQGQGQAHTYTHTT